MLAVDGYHCLPLLLPAVVVALRRELERIGPGPEAAQVGRQLSWDVPSSAYRGSADRAVVEAMTPALASLGLRPTAGAYAVTWPGELSGVGLHRSRSETRDADGRVLVWVSLDDPWEGAAETWVVPGSHRWPSTDDDADLESLGPRIVGDHSRRVDRVAGHAVILHPSTLRWSTTNRSDRPGLDVVATIARAGRARRGAGHRWPAGGSTAPRRPLTADDLVPLARVAEPRDPPQVPARVNPPRAWCEGCGTVAVEVSGPDPLVGRVRALCDPCAALRAERAETVPAVGAVEAVSGEPMAPLSALVTPGRGRATLPVDPARVLIDEGLDDQLRDVGYVTLPQPLLSLTEAADLRAAFGVLHGWEGRGFHNDFNDRDAVFRQRAATAIGAALDDRAAAVLNGFLPFIRPFLCKFPGEESYFEPHRDWMYVDEARGPRSFVVFVALEDLTPDNGQLLMLPRSHRLDDMVRGTHVWAPWLRHQEQITRRMVPLALRAGECAIWNHALVHGSAPNRTGRPRVAAALWVRPASAPLVHFRRIDARRAARYLVDEHFYDTANPYALMIAPPRQPVDGVVTVGGIDLTAEALEALLDDPDGLGSP